MHAIQVLGCLPETLWTALIAASGASFDMCMDRLPELFLTPSRKAALQATFSSIPPSVESPQRRITSASAAPDTPGTPLSTSTVTPLLFSMDLPWGRASYCVLDSTQVDSSCVRMENCVIDAPFNPDSYAPGLASEFLEALGTSGSSLLHLQISRFFPKSEVYFRQHPAQDQIPVPRCSALQFLAPGFAALSVLQHLDLSTSYQCDNCSLVSFVQGIGYMNHLTYLNLGHISVRRESLRCTFDSVLCRLTKLEFLALQNCFEENLPAMSLAHAISKLSRLTGLVLNKRLRPETFLNRSTQDSELVRVDASCLLIAVSALLQLQKLDLSSIPTPDSLSYDITNPGDVLRKFIRPGYLIGDGEIGALAGGCYPRMQVLTMITSLTLRHSSITDHGAMALGSCLFHLRRLQEFDFAYNDVMDRGALSVATSLSSITCLARLDVSGKSLLKEGAAAYASALRAHPQLKELTYNGMEVQSSLIMQRLRWTLPQMTSLVIADPDFNDRSVQRLVDSLQNNSVLKSLTLRRICNISSEGTLILAPTLASLRNLTHLTFESLGVEEEGAVAFCAALAWLTNLEALDINLDVFLEYHCCKVLEASLQWLGRLPQSRREEVFLACAGND